MQIINAKKHLDNSLMENMQRNYILLILLIISNIAFSQDYEFGIIQDKDGYTNIRYSPDSKAKILGTVKNDELIFIFDAKDSKGWYDMVSSNLKGFIHKSRVKLLTEFLEIEPSNQSENNIRFKHNDFSIDIFSEKFLVKNNKLQRSSDGVAVTKINGKDFYGTDGEIPKTSFKSIVFKGNKKTITVDKEQLSDIFEPDFNRTQVYFDKSTQIFYLTMHNSDGAGSYDVAWILNSNSSPKRLILDLE